MKKLLLSGIILLSLFSCKKEDEVIPTPKPLGCMCNNGTTVYFSHPNFPDSKLDTNQCSIIRTGIKYIKYYPQYSFYGEWKTETYTYSLKGFSHYVYDEKTLYMSNSQIPNSFKGITLWIDKPNPNTAKNDCSGKRTTSVQCGGTTLQGVRCKNNTLSCNGYCYLHGGN
jgi:hypothetical protein